MKKSYSEEQVIGALKPMQSGRKTRELEVSEATLYAWKSKCAGCVSVARWDLGHRERAAEEAGGGFVTGAAEGRAQLERVPSLQALGSHLVPL